MQIDRNRFLFLAGVIASGCGPRQPASEAKVASTADTTTTSGVDGGVPVPTETAPSANSTWPVGNPPTSGTASSGGGVGAWPASEGYPTEEGYPVPTSSGKKKAPKPQCGVDESVGNPGNCQSLNIDKSCAPFPFINSACADSAKFMKPKIAERAVACIRTRSPKQLCDAMSVYDCKDDALHTACPDPSADADCAAIQQACKKTSLGECRTYLSGLNALGRSEMVKCMKSNCSWGLYSCSEGL